MQAEAIIRTEAARRYLGQFCKHFAHKAPVQLDPAFASGTVTFGAGTCRLTADEDTLTLRVSGETPADIALLEDVTTRHLVRFAFREELNVTWAPAA